MRRPNNRSETKFAENSLILFFVSSAHAGLHNAAAAVRNLGFGNIGKSYPVLYSRDSPDRKQHEFSNMPSGYDLCEGSGKAGRMQYIVFS
jgi:hypothetical protein